MNIDKYRQEIDDIDVEILGLLNRRAIAALEIGKVKSKLNMKVKSREREERVKQQLLQHNRGPLPNDDLMSIYKMIIKACRNLQKKD